MADKELKVKVKVEEEGLEPGKIKSYAAQIKELKKTLQELPEGTAEYTKVQKAINDLKESQEDLNRASKPLAERFKELGGPLGRVAGIVDDVGDKFSALKGGLTQLGLGFKTFSQAVMTSGIGAIVVLVGLLVAAVMKAAESFEPLQRAMGRLTAAGGKIMDVLKPLTDFILNGVVFAIDLLATGVGILTGKLDEMNKEAANAEGLKQLEKNIKTTELFLSANADKYDQYTQRKLKANLEYNKKVVEINKLEGYSEIQKQSLLKQERDKADREIRRADADRAKANAENTKKAVDDAKKVADAGKQAAAAQKQAAAQRIQDRKSALQAEAAFEEANAALKKALDLENAKTQSERDKIEENFTKASFERKKKALETEQKLFAQGTAEYKAYNTQLVTLQADYINKNTDAARKQREQETAALKKELDNQIKLETDKDNTSFTNLKILLDKRMNAELEAEGLTESAKQLIRDDYAKRYKDALEGDITILKAATDKKLALNDLEVAGLNKIVDSEKETTEARISALKRLQEEAIKDRDIKLEALETEKLKRLEAGQSEIDVAKYVADQKLLIEQGFSDQVEPYIQKTKQIVEASNKANFDSYLALGSAIGSVSQAFEQGSKEAQAFAAIQELVNVATQANVIVTNLQTLGLFAKAQAETANAAATGVAAGAEGLKQGAKIPFPLNLVAIAAIVGALVSGYVSLKRVFSGTAGTVPTGGSIGTPTIPTNGGRINVIASRAEGGPVYGAGTSTSDSIPAMLSNGEFVVNAASTRKFGPIISAINEYGKQPQANFSLGSLSSSMSSNNSLVDIMTGAMDRMPQKTYVVANEMTNQQQFERTIKSRSLI
jgi:hypothetical protein